ncbi:MAG: hypothetical protein WC211_11050, partial [Dehalococcoidia bacterium]
AEAIKQTFSSRGADIPEAAPFALPETFVRGVGTERWRAFLGRTDLEAPPFPDVMELLTRFLAQPAAAVRLGSHFSARWHAQSGWASEE